MSRLVKCYGYCEKKHPKSEMTKFKNQNHCSVCYPIKVTNVEEREKLYLFIRELFNLSFPTGNMLRQIKTYKEERGYSYKNIRLTLNYIFNIKKTAKPITKYGIALVPHFHDEMVEYYKDLSERRSKIVFKKPDVVKVNLSPRDYKNKWHEKKFIDMEALLDDE